ncbi:MAG: O-antigen ligase family protein [Bacteroidota bacterium]|nr:O-antigen ligase family protein [Bacteroidota bacterium]MDP3144756.1 O-antigen ligase family protein [Bacteroidota bacterium]MDP3557873.1 O-antigen ligase family protein [Bacteroidota bacterium]
MAYILGNAYILAYKKDMFYPYNLLPIILIIVYTAIFHLQKLVFFLAFCTPLAISLKELGMSDGMDLSLPSEPLMAGIMLLYIFNELSSRITDKKFINHPITTLIVVQLSWMLFTTLTSTEVLISVKYLVSRLWFIFSCYIIMPHIFQSKKNTIYFMFCYASSLALVVFYTIFQHAKFNFNDKAADWVVSPFYNDHTAYGAALAMFIPLMLSFVFIKSISKYLRAFALALFCLFVFAIILSFARAGWLSLIVAFSIFVTLILKIKFRTILITLVTLGSLFYAFQTEIFIALGRNNTDAEGGFSNNIESVSNISTDASNLERLNRWSCAIRMWKDKPVLGWGPGTYMFKYAPYQLSSERTIISTNFGTNGNAHSEYLGPLAEQGIIGLCIVVIMLLYSTSLGYKLVYSVAEPEVRILVIGLFLGLMTYFVHGFLNNFLDTDKLSLPFWSFLAALVCIDLYYKKKEKKVKKPLEI